MSSTDASDLKTERQAKQVKKTGARNPLVKAAIAVIAIAAIVFGVHYWMYASSHISTDDAYLTADIITIAPQVSGTVQHVYVKDNQHVETGQLLAVLDDSTYRAAVQQAEANLEAATAAAEASGVNVGLTDDTGNAQIQQSEAGANQAESAVGSSEADVSRVRALVGAGLSQCARRKSEYRDCESIYRICSSAEDACGCRGRISVCSSRNSRGRCSIRGRRTGIGKGHIHQGCQ